MFQIVLVYFFFSESCFFASGFSSSRYKGSTYEPNGGNLQEDKEIAEKTTIAKILFDSFMGVKLHLKSSF